MKILRTEHSSIPGFAERFLREARAAAEIAHPSICDVYDAGEAPDGSLYLVLELLEGRDLGEAMDGGDLSVPEIVEIGIQTLDGLQAAHERGIIHRDVKPENVFLSRDDQGFLRVKLLDFGVAKNIRRRGALYNTQQGHVVGTPYYMSPEQAGGDETDRRADVWSTGAMLFHALANTPPFEAHNYNKLILKIVSQEPPSLADKREGLPRWLVDMIDGALKRDVGERWQTASQMAEGLRNKGEAPMGLDWEDYENATTRTPSPYGTDRESLAPPEALKARRTPSEKSSPAVSLSDLDIEVDSATLDAPLTGSGERPAAKPPVPLPPFPPPPAAAFPPRAAPFPPTPASSSPPSPAAPVPTRLATQPAKRGMGGFIAGIAVGIAFAILLGGGSLLWWLLS